MLSQVLGLLLIFHGIACSGVSRGDASASSVGGSTGNGGASASDSGTVTAGGEAATGGTANSIGGFGGCSGTPTLGTVTPAGLNQELSQPTHSFLLINVHTPLVGNIPGTDADIVYTDISGIEQFIGSDKSKPVVIYCYSDHMTLIAGPELVADGYCNIRYLEGGLSAWETAGYPVDPT